MNKRYILSYFCLLLLSWATQAETPLFGLIDVETGDSKGPYLFLHGGELELNGHQYKIMMDLKSSMSTKDKLEQMIIPKLKLDETDMRDLVDYLNAEAKKLDPESIGVHFILQAPKVAPGVEAHELSSSRHVKINLDLEELSVLDLIYLLNQSTGYKFLIQKNTVIITPK